MDTIINEITQIISNNIAKRYKMPIDEIISVITDEMLRKNLDKRFIEVGNIKAIQKRRDYKDFLSSCKKKVYNNLRNYHAKEDNLIDCINVNNGKEYVAKKLLTSHISTKERMNESDGFYDILFENLDEIRTVLDIGCGMNPLIFPIENTELSIQKYIAVDKDKSSIALLNKYAKVFNIERLMAVNWNIKEGWNKIKQTSSIDMFDLALVMKVVPVVKRQEPILLDILEGIPAKYILITGSRNSMTKKLSIESRERGVIKSFIENVGFEIMFEFNKQEEFGWVVRR